MRRVMLALGLLFAPFGAIAPANAQIVALGASIVQGYGVGPAEAFPAQVEAILRARGRPYTVANAGVYGDTTAGVLARMDSDVPAGTRIVVLAIGGNDVRRGLSRETAAAGIQQITARLRSRGIQVVNANPFIRAAVEAGMTQRDGIHLTPQGHSFVATRVAAAIR